MGLSAGGQSNRIPKWKLAVYRRRPPVPEKWRRCPVEWVVLQTGERIKRGCGRFGLLRFEAGWRCFYCGRYLYDTGLSLKTLWFHFRLAREYWRIQSAHGRDFINGMPVPGAPDPLPRRLHPDLAEPNPPKWFAVFVQVEDDEFNRYLRQKNL